MSVGRPLRFYCDESGSTGSHWLDEAQPILVHGGWLTTEEAEQEILAGLGKIRQRYRLKAPELKWTQFTRPGRSTAFREIFELCVSNGALPMFMVMDKQYAVAAKVVETFFDPLYNRHLPVEFTGDFTAKKDLAEATRLAPGLAAAFAPWLRLGERPTAVEVRSFAQNFAQHLRSVGIPSFAGMLVDFSDAAIDDLRDEFAADAMLRSTTWTVLWALASLVVDFVGRRRLTVEVLQDQIVRFDLLVEIIGNQPGVSSVQLVDSKEYPGIQLADLLCGFVRTVMTKILVGSELTSDELAICADLFVMKQEFEAWNGNLPESVWISFIQLSLLELKSRFAT